MRIGAPADVGVGIADVERIDRINILQRHHVGDGAGGQSARRDAEARRRRRQPRAQASPARPAPIVKGDARCLSIAAASIIAKVTRDRMMVQLAQKHPGYGFERHKGYATAEHHEAIKRLGLTAHHRRSFRTVQLALGIAQSATRNRRKHLIAPCNRQTNLLCACRHVAGR